MSDGGSWTILRVLDWTAQRFKRSGLSAPRLDAEVLLAHCLDVDRLRLYVDFDKPLEGIELERYRASIRRRLAREPVAYITGTKEFWSMSLLVAASVLIPRPETELLVERSLALAGRAGSGQTIVDVGTGSGAIAIALARELAGARILATDTSKAAVELAVKNGERHGVTLELHEGDLLDAVPDDIVDLDLVVANLPYVTSTELETLQPEVARWEPRQALDGGPDGLMQIRRLMPQVARRLRPGGAVALEIGWRQSDAVRELLEGHGFGEIAIHRDLAGLERVATARSAT